MEGSNSAQTGETWLEKGHFPFLIDHFLIWSFSDLFFVLVRVISWIVLFQSKKRDPQITRTNTKRTETKLAKYIVTEISAAISAA
jgi:hypothetical protein